MKKLLLILTLVIAIFTLAACGNKDNEPTAPDSGTSDGATNDGATPDGGNDSADAGSTDTDDGVNFDESKVTFASAYSAAQKLGFEGTLEEFIELISGKDGAPGKDGVTPIFAIENGELKITYDNGNTWLSLGNVKGENGAPGTPGIDGLTPQFKIEDGELCVSYDGGKTWTSLGSLRVPSDSEGSAGNDENLQGLIFYMLDDGNYYVACGYAKYLSKVVIPETYKGGTVVGIAHDGFSYCTNLKSITIPDSVTSIGREAFSGCDSLKEVHISDMASWCNISFEDSSSNPLCNAENLYLDGELITELVIPDGVTEIKDYAFLNCTSLTSVIIPDSVASIGREAFSSCGSLTSVTIPDSITSIGSSAFDSCDSLTSVTIPDSVTSIGNYAFSGCRGLEEIYFNATAMNDLGSCNCVFSNAGTNGDGIKVVIGKNVTKIPAVLFDPFFGQDSTKIVSVEFEEGSICESIGNSAFYGCTSLTSVTIPDSVTSIGERAFYKCTSLEEVHISDIASWCNILFYGYDSNPLYYAENLYLNGELITELVIPDGVTEIKYCAFLGCDSLTSVTIGNGVTSIGDYAFSSCKSLTSVTIGNGVTSIGYCAFSSCTFLMSVTIGKSVTSIGEYAFYYCTCLMSVTIGNGVTSIGECAFSYCYSLTSINYCGTEDEWKAITKGSGWDFDTGNYTITYNYEGE